MIDISDAMQLSLLLDCGYQFSEAIKLVDKKYQCYENALNQGITLKQLVTINNQNQFMKHFSFFLNICELKEAIKHSISICSFQKHFKQDLMKKISYPLLVFIMAFAILQFFVWIIIPTLINCFNLQQQNQFLLTMIELVKVICICLLLISLFIFIFIFILCLIPSFRNLMMCFFAPKFKIIQLYCSYIYAGYFNECMQANISTKVFINLLKKAPLLWLSKLANRLEADLTQGKALLTIIDNEVLIHQRFTHMLSLLQASHSIIFIERFMQQCELAFERYFKQVSLYIQIISYSFVGCLVIFVFQVLMVPLSMLEMM